jgi:hypothetical protein
MKPKPTLTLPTPELIEEAVSEFNRACDPTENAIRELFGTYPTNDNFNHVLWKVVVLNRLYSTNILAVWDLANHIVERAAILDSLLKEGSPKAVDLFSDVLLGGKQRNLFSFATKYCSWHNQNAYPIFDTRAGWYLWSLQKQIEYSEHFRRYEFQKYEEYKTVFLDFQRRFHLETYDFKSLDKFLWLHGVQNPPEHHDENHPVPTMEAEPFEIIDGVKTDAHLHADMLDNEEANAYSQEMSRKAAREIGLPEDMISKLMS